MIALASTLRPQALKKGSLGTPTKQSTSDLKRSTLVIAIQNELKKSQDDLDNSHHLHQINTMLNNASVEEFQSLVDALPDSALKLWMQEIQSNKLPSSGLSADQRQDFFTLLVKQLTPAQAQRWQSVTPYSLQGEFSTAIAKHDHHHQNGFRGDDSAPNRNKDALIELGSGIGARIQQGLLSPDKVYHHASALKNISDSHQFAPPANPENQAIIDAIDTIAPKATAAVKLQLLNAYSKVKSEMASVGTVANDSQSLVAAMQDMVSVFNDHGLGQLLPTKRDGTVILKYDSKSLPEELDKLKSHSPNGKSFGRPGWFVKTDLSSMPDSLLLKTAEQLLVKPLTLAFDKQRGFAPGASVDAAVIKLEQSIFANGEPDRQAIFSNMQALDAQVAIEGGDRLTNNDSRGTYISASLIRFAPHRSAPTTEQNNAQWGWVNTDNLSDELLLLAADQHRTDVLSERLNETGTSELETTIQAINAINPGGSEHQNNELVNQYFKLQRSILIASTNPELDSNLLENLITTNELFRDAGLPTVLREPTKRGYTFVFDSDTLPSGLGHLKSRKKNDRSFGETGWSTYTSLSSFPPALLIEYSKNLLTALVPAAASDNLTQINQIDGHSITHTADIQAIMDTAQLQPTSSRSADEPALGELLQKYDAESAAAESKNDYRQLADTSYLLASKLLTDSAHGMSQEQLLTLRDWIHADSRTDLGYRSTRVDVDHNDEETTVSLGPYGNFGKQKYQFSQAWLGSSVDERLAYFGIDKNRWAQTEPYISNGINSDREARNIERAEFDEVDAVKLIIGGVALAVTGNLASSAVSGMFGTKGALAGTVSLNTAKYLSLAAKAAVGGFSSTFILTDGDFEESLKSGLMVALSGGLSQYASSLNGATRYVAQAIINGVQSELNGKDFKDGVLASVGKNFGIDVADKLKDHMPEFIAGFAGKATEAAIRHGGDPTLIQNELEQYVVNWTTGQVSSKLTEVTGKDYSFVAKSLGELANVAINSGGNMDKIRDYLSSDQFYASLGNNLGNQITANFGGKENFSAVLYGKITNIMIASRGDPNEIANNIDGLALSVVGEWAGNQLTTQLGRRLFQSALVVLVNF